MFGLFKKDPAAKLLKEHNRLLEEAMQIQRSGDLKAYARKIEEVEQLARKIEALKAS